MMNQSGETGKAQKALTYPLTKFEEGYILMRNSIVMLIICFSVFLTCNAIEAKLLMLDDFKGGKINDNFWLKEGGVKTPYFLLFKK